MALSSISLCLILWYGTPVWLLLGPAYPFYLTAVTCSLMGSATFLLAYLVSRNTFLVARGTVLETIQNGVSFLLLGGSSAFLLVQTYFFLWPMYLFIPFFQAYPAMMAAGVLGAAAAAVHFMDSVLACRNLRHDVPYYAEEFPFRDMKIPYFDDFPLETLMTFPEKFPAQHY
ncbi:hypothetical protein HPB51_022966 [Rhipicephalus microplus]|uniref:Uncharacterized protein n=1 Tax=Rhipicephalus microplus TaxID=6941 RepID=A0A9J6DD53_RHIMP|nr:hypothetical protein HPB51_022966 [Rhipicephalus microplus]